MCSVNADSEPSFRLSFAQRPGYLHAHVSGPDDSYAIRLAYWRLIAAECRRLRPLCVLVSDHLRGAPPGLDEMSEVIRQMLSEGGQTTQRLAYVEHDSALMPLMEMVEVIARENGFVVRNFDDEKAAERWLRYGSADDAGMGLPDSPVPFR